MTAGLSHKQQRSARKTAMAGRAQRAAAIAVGGPRAATLRRKSGPPKVEDRDGLLWLIQKRKLSGDEQRGCEAYRAAYRHPPAGSIRSCIDPTRGDGSGDMARLDGVAQALDAARRLERYREVCLGGDKRLIDLMNAVAGNGLTIQAYLRTADSRHVLEAVTELRAGGRLVAVAVGRLVK